MDDPKIPDPEELRHRVRQRYRELCFRHGNPVLIKVLGQLMADQSIFALHNLAANLTTLKADEPGVFNDVGLALMAAGAPSMNTSNQRQLFGKETFKCAREIGRWLCENRLKMKLDPPTEFFADLNFDQTITEELERLGHELESPNAGDNTFLTTLLEKVADPRSTSLVCFAIALNQLQARKFQAGVAVALMAYRSSFADPETWNDCARFLALVAKASEEGLIVNDLPDWTSLMLVAEGADLSSVPTEAVDSVVTWITQGEVGQRAQLRDPQSSITSDSKRSASAG